MRNNLLYNKKKSNTAYDATLKVTTLLYLEEALNKERYEKCANLIKRAKAFGAGQEEINVVIQKYIRGASAPVRADASAFKRRV